MFCFSLSLRGKQEGKKVFFSSNEAISCFTFFEATLVSAASCSDRRPTNDSPLTSALAAEIPIGKKCFRFFELVSFQSGLFRKKILLIDDPFQRTGFFGGLVLELIPKNVFGVTSHSMLLSIKSK